MEHYRTVLWPNDAGEWFDRAQTFSTTPGHNGWTIKDTSVSGTPTYVTANTGGFVATLAGVSAALEIVTLYQGDKLIFDIDEIQSFSFYAKVSGFDAVAMLVMGLASAQNNAPDSVAANAWFKIQGSVSTSAIVVETDDGTTDLDDKATGQTLSTTMRKFTIDFTDGKSKVKFYIDDKRVAAGTTFDMSAYSSGLQPFVQIQRSGGSGSQAVTIRGAEPVRLSRALA